MAVRRRLHLTGPGTAFLTTVIQNWEPVLSVAPFGRAVLDQFGETAQFYRVAIVGYVLMPSHLHAVVGLEDQGMT